MFGTLQVSDRAADPAIALAIRRFFGAAGVRGFGGSPTDMGGIERIPHNQLHFAIGGVVGREELPAETTGGLMGSVPTAAFDPVFWVHHANVDRLWRVWECQAGRGVGRLPRRLARRRALVLQRRRRQRAQPSAPLLPRLVGARGRL